jgi:NADH-ubiquinone oxidoreductase chain 2
MFSFVGLPPLVGFFGKQMVLTAALDNHKDVLVIIAILTSVIGAVYYLSVIKTMYFDETEYEIPFMVNISLSNIYSISIGLLSLTTLLFILIPDQIINMCNLLVDISYSENFIN